MAEAHNADVLQRLSDEQRAATRKAGEPEEVRVETPRQDAAADTTPVAQSEGGTDSDKPAPRPTTKRANTPPST